jgi:DNA-binding beta-propeller fold protein YncE
VKALALRVSGHVDEHGFAQRGLSKTILTSPADLSGITANYTGAAVAGITFAATAADLPAAGVSAAVLTPGALPQRLYATNATNSVSVFDTAHGNAVLPAITGGGLLYPHGVALDASGKLYVSNNNATISIFDTAHGNAPLPPITGGNNGYPDIPWGLATDASGKLYVANDVGGLHGNGSISIFDTAHGNALLPVITGGGLQARAASRSINRSARREVRAQSFAPRAPKR